MDKTFEFSVLWARMWARRRRIGAMVTAATVLAVVVALLLPPWYRAQASLLPPSEEQSGFGLVGLIRGLAVPGVKIPTEATPADVFLAILESRTVSQQIVERFDLQRRYGRRLMDDAILELRRHAKFKLTEAGTLELAVEDHDRKRAAEMANAYVELLDRFNREVRMTRGRRTRIFLEQRLAQASAELVSAERILTDYQAKHKTVAISPELSSAVESAARLAAQRMALEVRLGVIRSYTRGSSEF
jgi:tyrosine-protein kinase Etk/Wzc